MPAQVSVPLLPGPVHYKETMIEVVIVQQADGLHRPVIRWTETAEAAGHGLPPRRNVEIISAHGYASDAVREAANWLAEHGL